MSPCFMPISQAKKAEPTGPNPIAKIASQSVTSGRTVCSNKGG